LNNTQVSIFRLLKGERVFLGTFIPLIIALDYEPITRGMCNKPSNTQRFPATGPNVFSETQVVSLPKYWLLSTWISLPKYMLFKTWIPEPKCRLLSTWISLPKYMLLSTWISLPTCEKKIKKRNKISANRKFSLERPKVLLQ